MCVYVCMCVGEEDLFDSRKKIKVRKGAQKMIFICHFPAEKYKKIQFRVLCVFQKANPVIQRFYFYHYNGNRYGLVEEV